MINKPDYEGFGRHQMERDKLGIPTSLNDLIELAFHYHLPIPKYIIEAGRVRRDDLITRLSYKWREERKFWIY